MTDVYTEFEAISTLTIERNKLLQERDEARRLAEARTFALLNICRRYCRWYDTERSGNAPEVAYELNCMAAGAVENDLPWKGKK